MLHLNLKDFNILGTKITTTNNKKDISLVSGYNSITQKIEQVLKTQKGELPSELSIGTDYYNFIFDPLSYRTLLQKEMDANISLAIPNLTDVKSKITYYDTTKITVSVLYTLASTIKNQTTNCTIEVPLQ